MPSSPSPITTAAPAATRRYELAIRDGTLTDGLEEILNVDPGARLWVVFTAVQPLGNGRVAFSEADDLILREIERAGFVAGAFDERTSILVLMRSSPAGPNGDVR